MRIILSNKILKRNLKKKEMKFKKYVFISWYGFELFNNWVEEIFGIVFLNKVFIFVGYILLIFFVNFVILKCGLFLFKKDFKVFCL